MRTSLPLERYEQHARRVAFFDRVLAGVMRLPGVVAAGYTTSVPLEWKGATSAVTLEGVAPVAGVTYEANHRQVSTGYLQAIGTPLITGRHFDERDNQRSQRVVIINETMARRFRPGLDPLGTRLAIDADTRSDGWFTIVGVVRDVRQTGLDIPPRPEMYIPYPQIDRRPWLAPRDLVVRTAGDPMRLARAVTRVVHDVDPTIAVSNVRTLDDVLDEDVASRRMGTTLLAAFAAFALLLAVVGIYGVTASFVAQHVPDLGVRIALGASAGDIIGLVVWKGLKLALTGIAIGAIAAVIV